MKRLPSDELFGGNASDLHAGADLVTTWGDRFVIRGLVQEGRRSGSPKRLGFERPSRALASVPRGTRHHPGRLCGGDNDRNGCPLADDTAEPCSYHKYGIDQDIMKLEPFGPVRARNLLHRP